MRLAALLALFSGRPVLCFLERAHHIQLLVDLDRTMAVETESTVGAGNTVALVLQQLVEGPTSEVQVDLRACLVCGRGRELGSDAHSVHGLLQSVDLFQIFALWRLLSGSLALIAASYRLRVALDDHWFGGRDLLLGAGIVDVSRRRGNNSSRVDHTDLAIPGLVSSASS